MKKDKTKKEIMVYWLDLRRGIKEALPEALAKFKGFTKEDAILYCDIMFINTISNTNYSISWGHNGQTVVKWPDENGELKNSITPAEFKDKYYEDEQN